MDDEFARFQEAKEKEGDDLAEYEAQAAEEIEKIKADFDRNQDKVVELMLQQIL